jgi:endogenous inhibitor of DNA gyrase (YacG/DUF329 family)
MSGGDSPAVRRRRRPCPVCGLPAVQKYNPFCSARCARIDLNRWLTGRYAIPAGETDMPDSPTEKDEDERGT